ncbi:DUF6262 family protein [Streptomyces sp. NPDC005474]|uniref:DUF6262 family protein n=1 Tax=Streptomyces sp. NPDC005474 TaxID=3154878 RepID=UPI00345154E7
MTDYRETAARVLEEPAWLRLTPCHAILWRHGEKGRPAVQPERWEVIDDTAFSQIMANLHLLGAPVEEGGFGDEQVMRIMMLQARLGRRISEIRMLDRDPLSALNQLTRPDEQDAADGAFVAKLRYQQTKIEQAPDNILVDAEVVAIIRAQQQWADTHLGPRWAAGASPKYLSLAHKMNRNADKPYPVERIHQTLSEFARQLGIRDSAGRLVDFNRTHRFRHTKATSLLNAGLPLHFVQRYFGHLSPAMLMHYAQTSPRPTSGSSCATGRSPPTPANCPPIRATSTTCWSWTSAPTASCPTACVAAAPSGMREGQCLPDLRQVRHRRHLPARTHCPAVAHHPAHRGTAERVHSPDPAAVGRGQRLARRTPPGAGRPRTHHPQAGTDPPRRRAPAGRPRGRRRRPHRRDHPQPGWELTGMRGNPDNLRQAAARKSAAAQARAEKSLREMIRCGQPITFRRLAQTADVSLDFLYRCTEIRQRVEQLRSQQRNHPPRPAKQLPDDSPSSVVRTLTAQLAELKRRHRDEVQALRQALEAAQSENLELGRRLGLGASRHR